MCLQVHMQGFPWCMRAIPLYASKKIKILKTNYKQQIKKTHNNSI